MGLYDMDEGVNEALQLLYNICKGNALQITSLLILFKVPIILRKFVGKIPELESISQNNDSFCQGSGEIRTLN